MRIQMKLSRDAMLAIQEIKNLEFSDPNITITNGYVVGVAYNRIKNKQVDWNKVATSNIPGVSNNPSSDIKSVKTTLNLEQNILDGIKEIQNSFFSIFNLKRVHKAYVVKMILFAAILDYNNLL
ncbi:hypothetical protein BCR26_17410 [Enterococcus rivorum]|uniref:Uncharacterized protein n=2 Tax=Enterococcus rivorum TaxID=762845 RepID=A0A1E5KU39_9ENTE|nr:hypothetical protein BCR26_17410 [Enterococcus rivorum]